MKLLIFALVEAPNVILSGADADRINHKPVGSIQISLHRRDVLDVIDRECAYVCVSASAHTAAVAARTQPYSGSSRWCVLNRCGAQFELELSGEPSQASCGNWWCEFSA